MQEVCYCGRVGEVEDREPVTDADGRETHVLDGASISDGFRIASAEIQTLFWFGVTLVGIALLSGQFVRWHSVDQVIAVAVLAGIGWLLIRAGG